MVTASLINPYLGRQGPGSWAEWPRGPDVSPTNPQRGSEEGPVEGTSHRAQSGRDTEGREQGWSVAEGHGEWWASVE